MCFGQLDEYKLDLYGLFLCDHVPSKVLKILQPGIILRKSPKNSSSCWVCKIYQDHTEWYIQIHIVSFKIPLTQTAGMPTFALCCLNRNRSLQ